MSKESNLLFVVDDDKFITSLVEKRFTTDGYRVMSFNLGEECLSELNKNPDLIILDYFFLTESGDAMNGMEVLEKIKEQKPSIPVVMLSGQDKGEVVLELARKGIEDYVIKDKNLIDNLSQAVSDIISRK
jgi:CheY-like chemotaxis protein